ncbi:MAG: YeeE/YedE family protein [Planctomycetes bacterium]|nr:YeeE/YedE family protein [Planctomycetota bacterium]
MLADLFASPGTLALGALTGLVFGFLLQKGGVTRFDVIVRQFLLQDFTMLKIMLSAVVVGGVGIYGMRAAGLDVGLHVKDAVLLGNVVGGVLFGIGMAVLGYCPGTGIAAIGDGSRHAIPGVLGMLFGAAVYAEVYPAMKSSILATADLGKVTFADTLGVGPFALAIGAAVVLIGALFALERFAPKSAA